MHAKYKYIFICMFVCIKSSNANKILLMHVKKKKKKQKKRKNMTAMQKVKKIKYKKNRVKVHGKSRLHLSHIRNVPA